MKTDRGFYRCKKCKILIKVKTMSVFLSGMKARKIIHKCPHCMGKIEGISEKYFNDKKQKLYLSIKRTFYKKQINIGIKYL